MAFIIPSVFIIIFIVAAAKKVNIFSSFSAGAGDGLKFTLSLVPVLVCVFMMCELMEVSGISAALASLLAPLMNFFGLSEELSKLVLIKPFSGSGSLSLLMDVLKTYGADSYVSRCACTIYASSETVFYISALYFAGTDKKGRALPLFIVLLSAAASAVISCALCRLW